MDCQSRHWSNPAAGADEGTGRHQRAGAGGAGWPSGGGELLVRSLARLATGALQPIPQDPQRASGFHFQYSDDFVITPERPARWAYNFACGLRSRPVPILIQTEGRRFRLLEAVDFDEDGILDRPWQLDGGFLSLACTTGRVSRARSAVAP